MYKNNTSKLPRVAVRSCALWLLVMGFAHGQVSNQGSLYIADGATMAVHSASFNFSAPATTQTSRTASVYGTLTFLAGASPSGASDSHFVDGYVRATGAAAFVFPIGQSGVYAPARAVPGATENIDAAYFGSSPAAIGTTLDTSLSGISSAEYWDIHGATGNVTISLTWRSSSNVNALVAGNLNDLTIAGWDGTQWVEILSAVDATSILGGSSTLTDGSISTTNPIAMSYTAYTLAARGGSCAALVASSGNMKTWNGSWSPSAPSLADPVTINAPFSGSLSCNSLVLNDDITLANGEAVEIVNGVSGGGKIVMASEASVVQRNNAATPPSIQLAKSTRLMRRHDYIYWGTPIAGDFFSQLAGAHALTAAQTAAFDYIYGYTSGTGGGWATLTATTTGRGFITRVKQQAPFTTTTATDKIVLPLTGTANNGEVNLSVVNNPASPNGGTSFNLLANPYPSAIDAVKFVTDNADIEGSVYLWTAATPTTMTGNQTYSQADYAVWNLSGTVLPTGVTSNFDGKIASGQGFKVKALGNGTVTFTNCMRLTGNNDAFLRQAGATRDRYKLTMTDGNSVFSQVLVAYLPDATYGFDRLYDASRNSVSTAQLYTLLDNRKLAINGRPAFDAADVIPVGVSKTATDGSSFTISIGGKEGTFAEGTKVYLHDKALGLYHDFDNGDYTFTLDATNNARFEIVYQAETLGIDDPTYGAAGTIRNGVFAVWAQVGMQQIELFDIAGRHIESWKASGQTSFSHAFPHEAGVYIAKVQVDGGAWATLKLIHN